MSALEGSPAPTDIYWSVLLVPELFSQISSENSAFLAKGIEVGRDENVLTVPLWFLAVLAREQFAA